MSRNISVYSHDTAEVAYAAYCNAPFVQRKGFTKLTKAQFAKQFPAKRAEFIAKQKQATTAPAPAANNDLITVNGVEYQMNDAGALVPVEIVESNTITVNGVEYIEQDDGSLVPVTAPSTAVYKSRTPREDIPEGSARNNLLWALNTEGFIQIVPEGGCTPIMQQDGLDLMSATFGPLVSK